MADTVSTSEIGKMRTSLQDWMPDRCTIVRGTKSRDGFGGEHEVPTQVAANVPCDLYPQVQALRPTEVIGGQLDIRQLWNISLPVGTDVNPGDEITVTTRNPNITAHVQSVLRPETYDVELRVVASLEGEPNVV